MRVLIQQDDFIAAQFNEGGESFVVVATSPQEFETVLRSKIRGGKNHVEFDMTRFIGPIKSKS